MTCLTSFRPLIVKENHPLRLAFGAREGQRCHCGGWKKSKRFPPTRFLSEGGGKGEVVGGRGGGRWIKTAPFDSRLERGRGRWWVKKRKKGPSDSRLERGRGRGAVVGEKRKRKTPPTRVWSEGGANRVVGEKRAPPTRVWSEGGAGVGWCIGSWNLHPAGCRDWLNT
jgi:hypothetical protein